MEKFRKIITRLLSVTLAAVMSLFAVGGSAFASVINYEWTVGWTDSTYKDWMGWTGNGSTNFSVDDKVHTNNSWYSIKLENTDYNISYVEKTYNVEPYTTYRFSAMVKYSGYALSPDAEVQKSGACVGKAYTYENSGYTTSSNWAFMEYEFTTGNETTYNLALQNGIYNGKCKGTAWFSDVKLEKVEMTNSWNMLAVFFKNIDATVTLNGKTVHHKKTISNTLIDEINTCLIDTLPSNLKNLSNNKMTVNSIDRYYVDETLTEEDLKIYHYKKNNTDGYCVDSSKLLVSKTLDKLLAQKHYNQIILIVPLYGINVNWVGLGGTKYKGVHTLQVIEYKEGAHKSDKEFIGSLSVHEIAHGLEADSRSINPDKTPTSHMDDYIKERNLSSWDNMRVYDWYYRYMNALLPNGEGLEPSVFYRTSGKYTLVSDDMTTGAGIEPGSSSVTPPAPKNLKVEAVGDDKVKITWGTVPKASGYQLALFKDADFNELWKDYDLKSNQNIAHLSPVAKGSPYNYAVRTAASIDGVTVYSDWTTLVYTHEGVKVVRGDIDNSGSFDFDDISVAITYFLNGSKIDDRTADAMGITGRSTMDFDDVQTLISWFLEKM